MSEPRHLILNITSGTSEALVARLDQITRPSTAITNATLVATVGKVVPVVEQQFPGGIFSVRPQEDKAITVSTHEGEPFQPLGPRPPARREIS